MIKCILPHYVFYAVTEDNILTALLLNHSRAFSRSQFILQENNDVPQLILISIIE